MHAVLFLIIRCEFYGGICKGCMHRKKNSLLLQQKITLLCHVATALKSLCTEIFINVLHVWINVISTGKKIIVLVILNSNYCKHERVRVCLKRKTLVLYEYFCDKM